MSTKTKTKTSDDYDHYDFDDDEEQQQPSGTYYHIEHAASGRAKCKKCKDAIAKGELRIATSEFLLLFVTTCDVIIIIFSVAFGSNDNDIVISIFRCFSVLLPIHTARGSTLSLL